MNKKEKRKVNKKEKRKVNKKEKRKGNKKVKRKGKRKEWAKVKPTIKKHVGGRLVGASALHIYFKTNPPLRYPWICSLKSRGFRCLHDLP